MKVSPAQFVIREAKRIRNPIPEQRSIALGPVFDPVLGEAVESWRTNGSAGDHPLHAMMSRVGGFPPALARYFIAAYSNPADIVFDPYCGKGTTVFEALRMGRNAIGGDIAPDAVITTRAKCARVSVGQVAAYIEGLSARTAGSVQDAPRNVRVFFSPSTLRQILSIRQQLLEDIQERRRRDAATFVCGVMLGLLHGHSRLSLSLPCNHCFAMAPDYVRRYAETNSLRRPRRDVKRCLLERSLELLPRPRSRFCAKVFEASAEQSRCYAANSAGKIALVLTSPPYLNRQTYLKDAWLRLWFLGRDRKALAGCSQETGSVIQFVSAMKTSLLSIAHTVAQGGTIVLICGQAKMAVGGSTLRVRISDLCLCALRETKLLDNHLKLVSMIHDRKLMSRGSYFAVYAGKNGDGNGRGHRRYGEEEILVFTKTGSTR